MKTTLLQSPEPLRNILYEMSLAQPIPDATLLDEYVCQYPQFADELTSFAIALVDDSLSPIEERLETNKKEHPDNNSPVVARAMSRFYNRVYEVSTAHASDQSKEESSAGKTESNVDPFGEMDRFAFRSFVQKAQVDNPIAIKLRDRQIDISSMSIGAQRHFAESLNISESHFAAYMNEGSQLPNRTHYKAVEKPTVSRKQTFQEAVEQSGLTEDQQSYLLDL